MKIQKLVIRVWLPSMEAFNGSLFICLCLAWWANVTGQSNFTSATIWGTAKRALPLSMYSSSFWKCLRNQLIYLFIWFVLCGGMNAFHTWIGQALSFSLKFHITIVITLQKKPCLPRFFSFISLRNNVFFWMATLQKKKSLKWELQSISMNLF